MKFEKWLDVFLLEKGVNRDEILSVNGPSGLNLIPVECLIESIKSAPEHERTGIKSMLVRIDFRNGPVLDYLKHLAQAVAR